MLSRKFFASVLLAVGLASSSLAAPWPQASKHTTHRVRELSADFHLETFHPEPTYEVSLVCRLPECRSLNFVLFRLSVMA